MMRNLRHSLPACLLALLPLPLLAAEPAATPPLEPIGAANLAQVILALLAVIALIGGMAWLLRRMGGFQTGAGGVVRVLGGVSMGQRERVVLVQVGKTQLLLGVAPGRVQTLHVLDEPISTESPAAGGERFADRLAAALKRGGPGQ